MLDFSEKTYEKLLDIAVRHNIIANCREYPSLTLNKERLDFNNIKKYCK